MKKYQCSILRFVALIIALPLLTHASVPTISWVLNRNALPRTPVTNLSGTDPATGFSASFAAYVLQAKAYDADGHIAIVWVEKTTTPYNFYTAPESLTWHDWAVNGAPANTSTIISDPNVNYDEGPSSFYSGGNPVVWYFRAHAINTSGESSPYIYWVANVGGSQITSDILPRVGSGANRLFLNTGDAYVNALNLYEVLNNQGAGSKLYFDEATSGSEWWFDMAAPAEQKQGAGGIDTHNLNNFTLSSLPNTNAVLGWTFRNSSNQMVSHDESYFLNFMSSCSNITVSNLSFKTDFVQRTSAGSHIRASCPGITVSYCDLTNAPGLAIHLRLEGNSAPSHALINNNNIHNTLSDGVHVDAGDDIQIKDNIINGTGDDAIGVINKQVLTKIVSNNTTTYSSDNHYVTNLQITNNVITSSGFRGIAVHNTYGTENVRCNIVDNIIQKTAWYGIEILPREAADGISQQEIDAKVTDNTLHRPWYINVYGNHISQLRQHTSHLDGVWAGGLNTEHPGTCFAIVARWGVNMDLATCNGSDPYTNVIDTTQTGPSNEVGGNQYALIHQPLYVGFNNLWYYYNSPTDQIKSTDNTQTISGATAIF